MKSVHVIMSTFNGEKFLPQQLESLRAQTWPIRVFAFDDGSADGTLQILKQWERRRETGSSGCAPQEGAVSGPDDTLQDPVNPILDLHVSPDSGQVRRGYPLCFLETLRQCPAADFYALCDQDDSWMPDRIETGVRCLEGKDPDKPLLFYSAVTYCDGELNPKRTSAFIPDMKEEWVRVEPSRLIYGGGALGMTFLFNHRMREILEDAMAWGEEHGPWTTKDELIKKIGAVIGEVYYTGRPLALYRRHPGAVMARTNTTSVLEKYYAALVRTFRDDSALREDAMVFRYLAERQEGRIGDLGLRALVRAFAEGKRGPRCFYGKRYRFSMTEEAALRLLILLGRK